MPYSLTPEAITYTQQQIAQRINQIQNNQVTCFEDLNVAIHYSCPDQITVNQPSIIIAPCNDTAWDKLLKRPPQSLYWLTQDKVMPAEETLPFDDPIPILLWGQRFEDGTYPFAEQREDGSIIFYADIIAATFFILSRWEETVVNERDEHGRFPAITSVAYKQGFLDRPVVDEYALILRAWLKVLRPRWKPTPRQFSIKLSHDIDIINPFPNLQQATRTLGRNLLKNHSLTESWQTLTNAVTQTVAPEHFLKNITHLARLSGKYGFSNSAFYFMSAKPAPYDNGYNLASSLIQQCIANLQKQGFEIGFHPGYHTFNNPERLAQEKARLDAVLDATAYGGRQHYLRFQTPDTWRHWEQVGLSYDSTMGYAEYEGFRCGTCHPFRPFDITQNRELNLQELPLIIMDATLYGYRKFTIRQSKERILTLAQRCQQVEGTFTLLWHNTSSNNDWLPDAALYPQVIKELKEMEG